MAKDKWVQLNGDKCKCPVCETIAYIALYPPAADKNFCPNCGADMREVKMPKVLNARLLSTEEASEYISHNVLPRNFLSWWLSDGAVDDFGHVLYRASKNEARFINPVLEIDIKNTEFKVGDEFFFGGCNCKIITESLAFNLQSLGLHRFFRVRSIINAWFRSNINK